MALMMFHHALAAMAKLCGCLDCSANLILLCSAHHRMVHEEGFSIEKDYQGKWYFLRPDGRPIAHGPVYSDPVSAETSLRTAPDFTDDYVSAASIQNGSVIAAVDHQRDIIGYKVGTITTGVIGNVANHRGGRAGCVINNIEVG